MDTRHALAYGLLALLIIAAIAWAAVAQRKRRKLAIMRGQHRSRKRRQRS